MYELRPKLLMQNSTLLIDDMQAFVSDWHKKRFPEFYTMSNFGQVQTLCLKLSEESGEVAGAFNKGETQIRLAEETMDCIVVCLQILDRLGQSAESIFDKVMEKNRSRL